MYPTEDIFDVNIGENMIFFNIQADRQNGEYETRKKSRGQIEETFRPGASSVVERPRLGFFPLIWPSLENDLTQDSQLLVLLSGCLQAGDDVSSEPRVDVMNLNVYVRKACCVFAWQPRECVGNADVGTRSVPDNNVIRL